MKAQLLDYQQRCNQFLQTTLQMAHSPNDTLNSALAYSTLDQGKRIRPALVYATGEAFDLPLEQLDAAACALELIHCYSLVHDDLPAMDDDDLRRGKKTCHIQYNEATAILIGDAQQTLAFELLATTKNIPPETRLEMIRLLSQSSGVQGMIAGQQFDLEAEGKMADIEHLQQLHSLKTGALLECALHLGAIQHPDYSKYQNDLKRLGQSIGLMFQIKDDILDIESDTETLGKPQGSDLSAEKSTYPGFLGLEQTKQLLAQHHEEAIQLLAKTPLNNDFFKALIQYIIERKH
jgi:geranylgeranyl pyrophosphate synthase